MVRLRSVAVCGEVETFPRSRSLMHACRELDAYGHERAEGDST